MKILIIADEVWNDNIHSNNVLTNWFGGMEAEFAEIYCSPGTPDNKCCDQYFQITDIDMLRSMIFMGHAGHSFRTVGSTCSADPNHKNNESSAIYKTMKRLSLIVPSIVYLIRDAIWKLGRYNKSDLASFISDFQPDIVFCPRLLTPKLLRLERVVCAMTSAPFVAFTGDDEASLSQINYDPLYWFRRLAFNRSFSKHVHIYSHYFMHSKDQANDYRIKYGVPTSVLYKCGAFEEALSDKKLHNPIKLVYAGRLYCNRWKTLAKIGQALKIINANGCLMTLDIYTQESLTPEQRKYLNETNSIHIRGCVSSSQLMEVYGDADIALHVESLDKVNKLKTKVSFSTKIIDLMASGCAILAICWNQHTGYTYLKENNAAICIDSYSDILPVLTHIVETPSIIQEYATNAYVCGVANHARSAIQSQLLNTFHSILDNENSNRQRSI